MVIWKYQLDGVAATTFEMPKGAKILSVQVQHEKICLWALIISASEPVFESRRFYVVGTGHLHNYLDTANYLGTIQLQCGRFIGHVFEGIA